MNAFQTITGKAAKAGLPFLVIGGYAVMAHGFIRATEDLDLLAKASQRARWRELLEGLGMPLHHEGGTFLQFKAPPSGRLPVDVMLVADEVFARMQSTAELMRFESAEVGVVSLIQLIALKCHAIRHADEQLRVLKDMDDLVHLIQLNGLDLRESELRTIILKHGNEDLYEKLQRACAAE